MNLKVLRAVAPVALTLAPGVSAQAVEVQTSAQACDLHVFPAEGVHSVGEDFDAVHGLDQDIRDYYRNAGRSLDWLTSDRQLALLGNVPIDALAGVTIARRTIHAEPVSRRQALQPGPRESSTGCLVEILLPQIMLERGGLATRSLRVFGVVRHYQQGALVSGYTGYAAAPMTGFQLRSPSDAEAATAIVERAYVDAVAALLRNSTKAKRR